MNKDGKSKGKKGKKGGETRKDATVTASELVVGSETNEFTADARSSIFGNDPTTSGPAAVELQEESEVRIGDRLLSRMEVDKMDKVIADATASAEKDIELRVPKSDPLKQVRILFLETGEPIIFKTHRCLRASVYCLTFTSYLVMGCALHTETQQKTRYFLYFFIHQWDLSNLIICNTCRTSQ